MKKNRELLERQFPLEYIANGLNGTRAYKAIKVNATEQTARVEASRLLAKPNIQKTILELLPSDEVESRVIKQALSTKPRKEMSWGEKHRYLETSLKLKGYLKDNSNTNNIQVNMVIKE